MTRSIEELLSGPRYNGYTYSYPHKTAYRPLSKPRPLEELWRDRSALYLYLHVPFSEMRCRFCNLLPDDGMAGLGCGARPYTRGLHWAVAAPSVKGIIADWLERREATFDAARYRIELDDAEQGRRFVLQSVATASGLPLARYRSRFGGEPTDDVPELLALLDRGLLERTGATIAPPVEGLAWADAIGPGLYSDRVRARMEGFVPR